MEKHEGFFKGRKIRKKVQRQIYPFLKSKMALTRMEYGEARVTAAGTGLG